MEARQLAAFLAVMTGPDEYPKIYDAKFSQQECARCVTYHLTEEEWCVRRPRRHLVGTHAAVSRQALATPWPAMPSHPITFTSTPLPLSPGSQTASPVLRNSSCYW
ncbi:hypothetical protein E2C01_052616 [Portunus trituberculatus]|uniref:Uncharacterized protein n=1 Tax=Portunus trituberculatus TaxID=210409 RepID=A0A5B7GM01_PORTR|nr:hypothetical protein [Portunus trituberculatus]